VAVTDSRIRFRLLLVPALLATVTLRAATLPEDRVEAMYHRYDGGGVTVDGPAVFARRHITSTVSASAEYYVDSISSASIDVVTSASPYSEQRTETSFGVDWLYGDALVTAGFTHSDESDYESDTYGLSVAQDVFGGMTTLSMGYAHGDDTVGRVDTDFEDSIDRDNFRLGVTQVLTPTLLATADYEAVLEDGYLANPYRSARILGAQVPERYPRTRTSHALAFSAIKSWREDTALRGRYRYFTDTWDVGAHTLELGMSRYFGERWTADLSYRYYTQDGANFYSDDFDAEYNYMSRDKELSDFTSQAVGGRVTWSLTEDLPLGLDRANLTFSYDYVHFDYDDFTDIRDGDLYEFSSQVFQLYFTSWY
jgi:hypothetical protein